MTRTSGVIAGAAVPHAPQFHSLPETEDLDQVERVRLAMNEIGDGLRALNPDLIIVMTNDHGDEFAVGSVPPFLVHCGARAQGMHKHKGWWNLRGDVGYDVLKGLFAEGFDPAFSMDVPVQTAFTIPFEFLGYDRSTPFLPIFINSYVPPQPSAERCYQFGQALDRVTRQLGLRTVFIASGGLSHFPGTPQYPHPDIETDKVIYDKIADGNLRYLLSFSDAELDRTGNVEARSIIALAGALGERKPDITAWEPSWHHTYGVFGWIRESEADTGRAHYPATPPERAQLARALFELRTKQEACLQFLADRRAFAQSYHLGPDEVEALIEMNEATLRDEFSIHPLLTAGAVRRLSMVAR